MLILGRNWDRFGGRCHEILNGFLISQIFKLEFGFIWPEIELFEEVNEQILFFSDNFIESYRLDFLKEKPMPFYIQPHITKIELERQIDELNCESIYLTNFFEIPVIEDVNTHILFSKLKKVVWSKSVLELGNKIEILMANNNIEGTIHLRYGDLLHGDFRQYPDVEKYIPFPAALRFLEKNLDKKVVIISDTQEIVSVAMNMRGNVVSRDFFKNQLEQTSMHDDLFDLVLLQESRVVFGPTRSAYSKLGAHLSGHEPIELVGQIQKYDWILILNLAVDGEIYLGLDESLRGSLKSRDLVWLLDFLLSEITLKEFNSVAKIACNADQENIIAKSQMAFGLACLGKFRIAKRIATQAVKGSRDSISIHRDPLFYSQAVSAMIHMIEILTYSGKWRYRRKISILIRKVDLILESLGCLDPFQLPKLVVTSNLEKTWSNINEHILHKTKIQAPGFGKKLLDSFKNFFNLNTKYYKSFANSVFTQEEYKHFLVRTSSALDKIVHFESNPTKEVW
jgi:hypothetical protein